MNNIQIGKYGENRAAEYLIAKGYQIVDRNFFTPYGEIDIIALSSEIAEKEYVFIEVKTRRYQQSGNPGESITEEKKEHMIESAVYYVQRVLQTRSNWRIDVITVEYAQGKQFYIRHYENALFE